MADLESLFLLEVLVDSVTFTSEEAKRLKETCVHFKFLQFPPFQVCEEDFSPNAAGYEPIDVTFNGGKSVLFSMSHYKAGQNVSLYVTITRSDSSGRKIEVGSTVVQLGGSFTNLFYNSGNRDPLNEPISKTLRDTYFFHKDNQVTGKIGILVRLSCFGYAIVTQFQVTDTDEPSFKFKNEEIKKEDRSQFKSPGVYRQDVKPQQLLQQEYLPQMMQQIPPNVQMIQQIPPNAQPMMQQIPPNQPMMQQMQPMTPPYMQQMAQCITKCVEQCMPQKMPQGMPQQMSQGMMPQQMPQGMMPQGMQQIPQQKMQQIPLGVPLMPQQIPMMPQQPQAYFSQVTCGNQSACPIYPPILKGTKDKPYQQTATSSAMDKPGRKDLTCYCEPPRPKTPPNSRFRRCYVLGEGTGPMPRTGDVFSWNSPAQTEKDRLREDLLGTSNISWEISPQHSIQRGDILKIETDGSKRRKSDGPKLGKRGRKKGSDESDDGARVSKKKGKKKGHKKGDKKGKKGSSKFGHTSIKVSTKTKKVRPFSEFKFQRGEAADKMEEHKIAEDA